MRGVYFTHAVAPEHTTHGWQGSPAIFSPSSVHGFRLRIQEATLVCQLLTTRGVKERGAEHTPPFVRADPRSCTDPVAQVPGTPSQGHAGSEGLRMQIRGLCSGKRRAVLALFKRGRQGWNGYCWKSAACHLLYTRTHKSYDTVHASVYACIRTSQK